MNIKYILPMNHTKPYVFALSILVLILFTAIPVCANTSLDYLNRILGETGLSADKNIERLSQGTRLLADDPANYAIYEKLEAQVRGLSKEIGNSKDVLGYYGFGESLVGNMIDSLQRIRELLVARSNPILSKEDLGYLDSEIEAQYDQILFLLQGAEFNKIRVYGTLFEDPVFKDRFKSTPYFSILNVDGMLGFLVNVRSVYGAKMNQLEERIKSQMTARENYEGFQSVILDLDYGTETSLFLKNQVLILANLLLLGAM